VEKRIGSVAYRLVLLESSKIHPLFHVSQLKKVVSPQYQVLPALPVDDPTLQLQVLLHILQRRPKRTEHKTIAQVMVQWSNSDASAATWEDLDSMRQQFPRALAWGQAVTKGGGGVSIAEGEHVGGQLQQRPTREHRKPARLAGPE
jgi:hypothetical protein